MQKYEFIKQTIQNLRTLQKRDFDTWFSLTYGEREINQTMTEDEYQDIYDYLKLLKNRN